MSHPTVHIFSAIVFLIAGRTIGFTLIQQSNVNYYYILGIKKYDLLREYYKIRLDYQSNETAEFDNIDGRIITFSRSTELGLMIIDSLFMLLSLFFLFCYFRHLVQVECSFYCIRTTLVYVIIQSHVETLYNKLSSSRAKQYQNQSLNNCSLIQK